MRNRYVIKILGYTPTLYFSHFKSDGSEHLTDDILSAHWFVNEDEAVEHYEMGGGYNEYEVTIAKLSVN